MGWRDSIKPEQSANAVQTGSWRDTIQPEKSEEEKGLLGQGFDYAMRGLDYPGGLARTGLAGAAGMFQKENPITKEDWMNALKGQAPTSAKYLERLGLEEGPSADLPLLGKTSLRDVEGFGLDVATDPLTALVKIAKPISRGLIGSGEKLYKSGLKNVDKNIVEKGGKAISDVLLENGMPTGSMKTIAKKAGKVGSDLMEKRAALYQQATDAGARIDPELAVKEAREAIAEMRKDPGLRDTADKLDDYVNKYVSEGPIDVETASSWKTNFYNSLPDSAYGPFGKIKAPAQKVERALGKGFKNAIESSVDSVLPGAGKQVSKINESVGSVLSSKKPFVREIRKSVTPNAVTSVDLMLGSGGLLHSPAAAIGMLAAKKAADISKTTAFRTMAGKGARTLGLLPVLDPIAERALINRYKDE